MQSVTNVETINGFTIQRHDFTLREDRFYTVLRADGTISRSFHYLRNARKHARLFTSSARAANRCEVCFQEFRQRGGAGEDLVTCAECVAAGV